MRTGIHHITSITGNVQANVDFYMDFLGLSLVKQTAGFEDGEQLHLFYGDALGSPGSLISFLVWEDAGRGRTGIGQISEVTFAVAEESLGDWLTRALARGIPVEGPQREFGAAVLRLKDPDGLIVKLVAAGGAVPRIYGATFLSDRQGETAEFVMRFGYHEQTREGLTLRMASQTDVIDIRAVAGFVPSIAGAGVPDHIAFRAADAQDVAQMRVSLKEYGPTSVHDRTYFMSLYVREPAGTLIEFATDAPGMTVDEAPEALGRDLKFPPHDRKRAEDLRAVLPQFARPGEERLRKRDLPFVHRLHLPEDPDGSLLLLLHASGGSETDLMPFAKAVHPRATLLALRGRALEEGKPRWFRRFDFRSFDQHDLRFEVEALEAFIQGAVRGYALDADKVMILGHSNGANFGAAALRLKPELFAGAILMRAQEVLEDAPQVDLGARPVLLVDGKNDLMTRVAPKLALQGEKIETRTVNLGHELGEEDRAIVRDWLHSL